MPTKTEQADLLQAMFGRNGESPVPVVCANTPADAFEAAFEAARIALTHMTPVILLSDGYVANGSEPWAVPEESELPAIDVEFAKPGDGSAKFRPYERDPKTLARPWALPGTPGLMHRIGGLEKEDGTGNISYDPENHEHMIHTRANKVAAVAASIPPLEPLGDGAGDLLFVGWGSTEGAITAAVRQLRQAGKGVSAVFLRHLNPFAPNLEAVLKSFRRVLVPELNLGQLAMLPPGRVLGRCSTTAKGPGVAVQHRRAGDGGRGRAPPNWIPDRNAHLPSNLQPIQAMTTADAPLTKKDYKSDQDVRWCPGCGTTESSTRCSRRSPSWASASTRPWWFLESAARAASRTTWRPTGSIRSTVGHPRSRRA